MTARLRGQIEMLKRVLAAQPARPAPLPVTDRERAAGYLQLVRYLSSRWGSPRWDHACELIDWYAGLGAPAPEQTAAFLRDIHAALATAFTAPPDADEEEGAVP
jgi:hypothetical protein